MRSLTRAGLGFWENVGVCMLSTAAAGFELSSLMLLELRKDKLDLGLTAKLFPGENWLDLCLSLSLAAIKRVRGEATDACLDAPLSPPFRLRSLRSNKGLNLLV